MGVFAHSGNSIRVYVCERLRLRAYMCVRVWVCVCVSKCVYVCVYVDVVVYQRYSSGCFERGFRALPGANN